MWKDIKDYEGWYQISDSGVVRSLDRTVYYKDGRIRVFVGKELKPKYSKGYPFVILQKNKKSETFTIHKLVADAFMLRPAYAQCVNHLDGNKTNNHVENLEWCTMKHNNIHARQTGLNNANAEHLVSYNREYNAIKVIMEKNNRVIHVADCSRDMAEYVQNNLQKYDTKIDTIARQIRTICKQKEVGYSKIEPNKRKKSLYGFTFRYLYNDCF